MLPDRGISVVVAAVAYCWNGPLWNWKKLTNIKSNTPVQMYRCGLERVNSHAWGQKWIWENTEIWIKMSGVDLDALVEKIYCRSFRKENLHFLFLCLSPRINIRTACAVKETASTRRVTLTFHSPYRSCHSPSKPVNTRSKKKTTTLDYTSITKYSYTMKTNWPQEGSKAIHSCA